MAQAVRWYGGLRSSRAEVAAEGKCGAEEDRRRSDLGQSDVTGRQRKKVVTLAEKQQSANYLQDVYSVSERRACQVLSIHRNTKRAYEHKEYANEMEEVIIRLSEQEPRWGYRKVYDRMKLDGYRVGRESVRLVRKREGLQVRRKQHKKHYPGPSSMLAQASRPNHVWTYDFVMDQTMDSRRLKFLTVAD